MNVLDAIPAKPKNVKQDNENVIRHPSRRPEYVQTEDPNADTEWNAILRKKGILPEKEAEINEEDIIGMVEDAIQDKTKSGKDISEMTLDELDDAEDDLFDEEDERVMEQYRKQRIAELKDAAARRCFGDIRDISKSDWVREVNQAGEGVCVVVHVYRQGNPVCSLVEQHTRVLAAKFPDVKFLRGEVSVCIPNYPDSNLPTLLIYKEDKMLNQFVGAAAIGGVKVTADSLEWKLSKLGVCETELSRDPLEVAQLKSNKDTGILCASKGSDDEDNNDW